MSETSEDHSISEEKIEKLIGAKYELVHSERLGREVYTLKNWIDKTVFKKHKKLFGYTDIGWTVKHPKQLIRALVAEGIWTENGK